MTRAAAEGQAAVSGQKPSGDVGAPPDLPFWLPPLFYLALATLFLHRCVFGGDVFLPAGLLGHVAPWSAAASPDTLPPWNPLRWDSIAQFYPWRYFAHQAIHAGVLPLWNPYSFCGTPFVANSQSAVFYPGSLLFYLLPTAQAFTASALLHLTLCGWFTYLFLRRLRCAGLSALSGGVIFTYSAWQVAWLQLPTFLATACWLPLALCQIERVWTLSCRRRIGAGTCLGAALGMMLLAGHLQIAFYGLLACALWTFRQLASGRKTRSLRSTGAAAATCLAALLLGFGLAAPQILPALELSRVSHRAGTPTAAGYQAYVQYGLPAAGLVGLSLPDFYGGDSDPENPYWGFYLKQIPGGPPFALRHNAAETAVYIGLVTLAPGLLALQRGVFSRTPDSRMVYAGALALLALLLALGTPLNALLYFGVPGFGQSGSPARCLVLWAFAGALLGALGLDSLHARRASGRELLVALCGLMMIFAIGLSLAARAIAPPPLNSLAPALGEVFRRIEADWGRLALLMPAGLCLLLPQAQRPVLHWRRAALSASALLAPVLITADLFLAGIRSNPTAPRSAIYPVTPGLRFVQERIGHDRIQPANRRWSLYQAPHAILPPNAGLVYGLRDVQGYDSLLTGQYKTFANRLALPDRSGARDASPPEVGNMVFVQDPSSLLLPDTGAVFSLMPPARESGTPSPAPTGEPLYMAPGEMAVYRVPGARGRAELADRNGKSLQDGAQITWQEDGPTRLRLTVTAPGAAMLNLADQFFPGWKAECDGAPVPIQRSARAALFRTVAVPAGTHTIAFRYDPAAVRVGLFLACLAALLLTSGATLAAQERQERNDTDDGCV